MTTDYEHTEHEKIEENASYLLNYLTEGLDFSIPDIDWDDSALSVPDSLLEALKNAPNKLTLEDLTERVIDGNGVFDGVMTAMKAHLVEEYNAGRITGAEYTKAYIAMLQVGLQQAVQFLVSRDTAYYQALAAAIQAIQSSVEIYAAKVQLAIAQAQAHLTKAQYAAQVLQLGQIDKQTDFVTAQTEAQEETIDQILAQTDLVKEQIVTQQKQQELLVQQTEQAHAQVSDTQMDGTTPVTGYTGHQNSLLTQQIRSFKNDHVLKGAKVFADSFATQLSMSTATVEGTGLDSSGISTAIQHLQTTIANEV